MMTEVLGVITAVLVLLAALFGLIPPLLAGPNRDPALQRSASEMLSGFKDFFAVIAIFGFMFLAMFWPIAMQRVMAWGTQGPEPIEVLSLEDRDRNLLRLVSEIWNSDEREIARQRLIDYAIAEENFPLAIAAAEEIWSSSEKNVQLHRVLDAMIGAPIPQADGSNEDAEPIRLE